MRFTSPKFILILVFISSSAYAAKIQHVKLNDGSVMNVEVISLQNGVYTFKSQSLGEFKVNAKQVQSISSLSMPKSQANVSNQNLKQIQTQILSKPGSKELITGLQNDPDMQAVLSDPEVMKAIQNHDYTALANNPKFKKLMNNPAIKQITGSVTQ